MGFKRVGEVALTLAVAFNESNVTEAKAKTVDANGAAPVEQKKENETKTEKFRIDVGGITYEIQVPQNGNIEEYREIFNRILNQEFSETVKKSGSFGRVVEVFIDKGVVSIDRGTNSGEKNYGKAIENTAVEVGVDFLRRKVERRVRKIKDPDVRGGVQRGTNTANQEINRRNQQNRRETRTALEGYRVHIVNFKTPSREILFQMEVIPLDDGPSGMLKFFTKDGKFLGQEQILNYKDTKQMKIVAYMYGAALFAIPEIRPSQQGQNEKSVHFNGDKRQPTFSDQSGRLPDNLNNGKFRRQRPRN